MDGTSARELTIIDVFQAEQRVRIAKQVLGVIQRDVRAIYPFEQTGDLTLLQIQDGVSRMCEELLRRREGADEESGTTLFKLHELVQKHGGSSWDRDSALEWLDTMLSDYTALQVALRKARVQVEHVEQ